MDMDRMHTLEANPSSVIFYSEQKSGIWMIFSDWLPISSVVKNPKVHAHVNFCGKIILQNSINIESNK